MTDENDIDAAAEMADRLIEQLDQETCLTEHSRKAIKGAHEILKMLEKSILHNINLVKEGCECQVCIEMVDQFEMARDAVQKIEHDLPERVDNPMQASFLLGTSSAVCVFMPNLITSILQTGAAAHRVIATTLRKQIVAVVQENYCQDDNTTANDPSKKPN